VYIHYISFIHSSFDGHVGWFNTLTVVNRVMISMGALGITAVWQFYFKFLFESFIFLYENILLVYIICTKSWVLLSFPYVHIMILFIPSTTLSIFFHTFPCTSLVVPLLPSWFYFLLLSLDSINKENPILKKFPVGLAYLINMMIWNYIHFLPST
jgi:hypothetical protein